MEKILIIAVISIFVNLLYMYHKDNIELNDKLEYLKMQTDTIKKELFQKQLQIKCEK